MCILRLRAHNYITKMHDVYILFSDYTSCHQCILLFMLFCYDVKSITSQKQLSSRVHISGSRPKGNPQGTFQGCPGQHTAVSSHTLVPRPPPFYFCVHNNAVNANRKGGLGIIHRKLCISVQLHVSNCIITEVRHGDAIINYCQNVWTCW